MDPFQELQCDILKYSSKGNIIFMGDFNARKGNLNDNLENIQLPNCLDDESSNLYDMDETLPPMNFRDFQVNTFGRSLVELCFFNSLCFLNGRKLGDRMGNYTCFTYNGVSVVDYAIVSQKRFDSIKFFEVLPLTLLSNHCPNLC